MSQTRKVYDREFKLRAVERSHKAASIPALAKELGIQPGLLYSWRNAIAREEAQRDPGQEAKKIKAMKAKNARMKKQIANIQAEIDKIRKSIEIFSPKRGKSTGA